MIVTFTRVDQHRYAGRVERTKGGVFVMDQGPGGGEDIPHDLAHLVVEAEFGIVNGIFGQVDAGGAGMFHPERIETERKARRRGTRLAREHGADALRSERLVYLCMRARRGEPVDEVVSTREPDVSPDEIDRAARRLEELARRWQALAVGESIALSWRTLPTRRGRRARIVLEVVDPSTLSS